MVSMGGGGGEIYWFFRRKTHKTSKGIVMQSVLAVLNKNISFNFVKNPIFSWIFQFLDFFVYETLIHQNLTKYAKAQPKKV